ncbi:unnamed protein product [Lota lota]
MECTLFLLVAFIFSSGQCDDSNTSLVSSAGSDLVAELAPLWEAPVVAATSTNGRLLEIVRLLVTEMTALRARLGVYGAQTLALRKLYEEQAQRIKSLEESRAAPVAFTAALGHPAGPFRRDTTVRYDQVLSNVGGGYDQATGTFTAVVPGTYFFSYTMYNNNVGKPNSVLSLMKNGDRLVSTWDTAAEGDVHDSATNAAVVELVAGDGVSVNMDARRVLYDDAHNYNTFSGFLLFPL